MKKRIISAVSLLSLITNNAYAQTNNEQVIIENKNEISVIYLKTGSYYIGKIVSKNFEGVNIESENKKIFIPIDNIDSISENVEYSSPEVLKLEVEKERLNKQEKNITNIIQLETEVDKTKQKIENLKNKKQAVWFSNPNYTRLFFAPTAMPLKKGSGYLQDIDLFVGAANYGITDNISIGGLASLIPGVSTDQQVLAFTPKIGFDITPDAHIGGGILYVGGAGLAQVGVAYGIGTVGNADTNLSLGFGGGYGNIGKSGFFPKVGQEVTIKGASTFITMIGGTHRIFEHVSIVSENWVLTNSTSKDLSYLFSYGLRIFWEKVSFDAAVVYPSIPNTTTYPFPYLDLVWTY